MFKHREDRKLILETIFFNSNPNIPEPGMFEPTMWKLEKLLLRENNLWWEIATLETYVAQKIVPQGLKIEKIPAYNLSNETFMKEWDKILDSCSLALIALILKEKHIQLKEMEGQIKEINDSLNPYKDLEEFKNIETKIIKRIKDNERELILRKQKKFRRDNVEVKTRNIETNIQQEEGEIVDETTSIPSPKECPVHGRTRKDTYNNYYGEINRDQRKNQDPNQTNRRDTYRDVVANNPPVVRKKQYKQKSDYNKPQDKKHYNLRSNNDRRDRMDDREYHHQLERRERSPSRRTWEYREDFNHRNYSEERYQNRHYRQQSENRQGSMIEQENGDFIRSPQRSRRK